MKVNRKQSFVFRKCDLLMPFFILYLKNTHVGMYISIGVLVAFFGCILAARKENLTVF